MKLYELRKILVKDDRWRLICCCARDNGAGFDLPHADQADGCRVAE